MSGALTGLRVIELGQLIAGPFCGQLLADMGADVIKVEPPIGGDPMRQWGNGTHKVWWSVIARNKRCITADLRQSKGQGLVRRLIQDADILIENFRPGTLEKWGLGWSELQAINPRLILVRVSGYGQTGPYAHRAGFAVVGEAMGGLRHLIGEPDRPPARAGISIGDTLAATYACLGALAALTARQTSGRGQVVDCAIYEAVLQVMESLVVDYHANGVVRERSGSFLPGIAPSNAYPCKDGMMVIGANQDTIFARLAEAMGQPGLAADPRFASHILRGEHQQELDTLIAAWTRTLTMAELDTLMDMHAIPAGRIYTAPDMLADPHFAARAAIIRAAHPQLGELAMQNVFPRLSETPGEVRWTGPALGAHNQDVYGALLGLSHDELALLAAEGVI
jgi:crotonobetainyl-CoA:carnitine CoA-transferase CaiB-like acyl-CoA transferase